MIRYIGRLHCRILEARNMDDSCLERRYSAQYKYGLFGKWETHTEYDVYTYPSPDEMTITREWRTRPDKVPVQYFTKEHVCGILSWMKHYDAIDRGSMLFSRIMTGSCAPKTFSGEKIKGPLKRRFSDVYAECARNWRGELEEEQSRHTTKMDGYRISRSFATASDAANKNGKHAHGGRNYE